MRKHRRKFIVQSLAYAYAERLRTYRSRPSPVDPDEYRKRINLRLFLDEQLDGSAYRWVAEQGWDFERFCQAVRRQSRELNCGPVQTWESSGAL
jgi:hypothetical protein